MNKYEMAALAHKTYLAAAWDDDWLSMLICWGIITNLEGDHRG